VRIRQNPSRHSDPERSRTGAGEVEEERAAKLRDTIKELRDKEFLFS
jgi:hypothetical protein